MWYACGQDLESYACDCIRGRWRGKVSDLDACQRSGSENPSMILGQRCVGRAPGQHATIPEDWAWKDQPGVAMCYHVQGVYNAHRREYRDVREVGREDY